MPGANTHKDTTLVQADRIVRPGELTGRLSVSLPTLWRMRRRSEIPEPLRISRGVVGWRESTIERWLEAKEADAIAAREVKP